uniref:Diguanylate cyclase n=2 Tax=Cohnella candidum TaxID=2674991 RepID=A0A3G3K1Q7_9BACL|nr:diguanylate cyclase [Cohnella candidum]
MFQQLFNNFSVLTISALLGSWYMRKFADDLRRWNRGIIGLCAGSIGILLMTFTVQVGEHVIVDARQIAVMMGAFFGGLPAALISVFMIAAFRILKFGVNEPAIVASMSAFVMAVLSAWVGKYVVRFHWKWMAMTAVSLIPVAISFSILVPHRAEMLIFVYTSFIIACSLYCIFVLGMQYRAIEAQRSKERAELEVSAVKQELAETIRLQQGLTFKMKKVNDKFIYTMADGQLLYQLGLSPERCVGKTVEEVMPASMVSYINGIYERVWAGETVEYESGFNGFTYLNWINPVRNSEGKVIEAIASGADITARKKAEKKLSDSELRHRRLVALSPNAILVAIDGKIAMGNQQAAYLIGIENEADLADRSLFSLVPEEYRTSFVQAVQEVKSENDPIIHVESKFMKFDGTVMDVEVSIAAVPYNDKLGVMLSIRNVTERKLAELRLQEANQMLSRMATKDGLTGISNRRHFDEMLDTEWKRAIRESSAITIVMCDIDHFKAYNDTYGHLGGDECLKKVASAIDAAATRPGDMAARYGGEEFILLLPDTDLNGGQEVASRLREAVLSLRLPHEKSQAGEIVTISAGVASLVPQADFEPKMLIDLADKALYQAKLNGRNRVAATVS